MYAILNGSEKIYNKLKEMFNTPDQRGIIITAFVGGDAAEILPQINHNVTLYCWPKAGGTNPDGVIDLLEKGVNIRFVDKLHMKIYWAEGKGAIIGSANLSTNALGGNGLQEVGVYLKDFSEKDINDVVNSLGRITEDQYDIKETLKILERKHGELTSIIRGPIKQRDFEYWYRNYSNGYKRKWKMVWFESGFSDYGENALNKIKNEYNLIEPYDACIFHGNLINEKDIILLFKTDSQSEEVILDGILWLYVDFCADLIPKKDKEYDKYYSRIAVQAKKDSMYYYPFKVDMKFKKAFKEAVEEYGYDKIKDLNMKVPSKKFLELLYRLYRKQKSL